jgi:hypothetical protein
MIGVVLAAALSQAQVDNLPLDAKYDLSCATAAAWAMSWAPQDDPKGKALYDGAFNLSLFYLGRLSGRDNGTRWMWVVRDQLQIHRLGEAAYSAAMDDCVQRMSDKVLTMQPK